MSCAQSKRYREISSCAWFREPGSFFSVSKQSPYFTAVEEDRGNKRLAQFELAGEADGVASPHPVILAIAEAYFDADLC